jgi:hypothetical protein
MVIPLEPVVPKAIRSVRIEISPELKKALTKIASRESRRAGRLNAVGVSDICRASLRCALANTAGKPLANAGWFDWIAARAAPPGNPSSLQLTVNDVRQIEQVLGDYQNASGEKLSIARFCRGVLSAFVAAEGKARRLDKVAEVWFSTPDERASART